MDGIRTAVGDVAAEPRAAVSQQLRRSVGTWPRRLLLVVTLALGVLGAVAVGASTPPGALRFDTLVPPVQSLMSITLPLAGVLLASDLRRHPRATAIAPLLVAVTVVAVAVALVGSLLCALVVIIAGGAVPGRWEHALTLVPAGVLVQVLAQLVGTALGLLLRAPAVAFGLSVVLPLGVWALLGAVGPLRPAQPWVTPFGAVQTLLAGPVTGLAWVQWLVVLALWGVAPLAVGWRAAAGDVGRRPG